MPFTERATESTSLVAIPPIARTVLYYVLALANAVLVPLTASGRVDPDLSLIVIGVSGVFGFTLAASNVTRPDVARKPFTE
jgi:hypothetical protein